LRRTGARSNASPVRHPLHSTRPASRVGRWLSRDPLPNAELSQGANLYWYVRNNPIANHDLFGLYFSGGAGFNEKAADICACGLLKALKAAELAQMAKNEASNRYPVESLHNGNGDAFRHCFWSCEMAKQFGQKCAKAVGENHETADDRNGQPKYEHDMDTANNAFGRSLASPGVDCAAGCSNAIEDKKLTVINT